MAKYIVVTTDSPTGYSHWYYNPQVDVAFGFLILLLLFVSIAAIFTYRNEDSVIERVYYVDVERGEGGKKEELKKDSGNKNDDMESKEEASSSQTKNERK